MASINHPLAANGLDPRCYRLTPAGRACVDFGSAPGQTLGSLSRYLQDVLAMCGSGIWFEQLRQFMPLRSLEESLRTLLALGLIEIMEAREAPPYVAPRQTRQPRRTSSFGLLGPN
jgi:hypothetical protein